MKFERGQTVFVSSPEIVREYEELCVQGEYGFQTTGENEYYVPNETDTTLFPAEHIFPSRIDAEAAGRAFVRDVMAEERRAFEERMGRLHKMLKEER